MSGENPTKMRKAEDMAVSFPPEDLICKDCFFRRSGVLGYRTAYCEMFPRGKPDEILFDGAGCPYRQVAD